jgi:hypothetical protein
MVVSPDLEEWMNPRTKFLRTFAMIGAIGVGIAACSDNIVNVPETRTITAAPAAFDVQVGQTRQIGVTVTGVAPGATFQSGNAGIASVDVNTGLVTGVAVGSTTITVTSTADPSLQTQVSVNVTAAPPEEIPPTEDISVAIQSVTQGGTTFPVNPDNVFGQIDVTLSVERGSADSLKVFLGDVAIPGCTQRFGPAAQATKITAEDLSLGAQASSIVCSVNTAAYDTVTGTPRNLNAVVNLSARIYDENAVADQSSISNLTLNNADTFHKTVNISGASALSPGGLLWRTGDVTVTALPVMYSGRSVTSLSVTLADNLANGAAIATRTDTSAPFIVTFPANVSQANNGVDDVETQVVAYVSASVADGLVGPTTLPAPPGMNWVQQPEDGRNVFRLDNADPDAGDFQLTEQDLDPGAGVALTLCCSNNWVGENYNFAAGKTGHSDDGVGIDTVTFHVGAANLTNAQLAAQPAVTMGSQLPETAVNTGLRAVAVVRDRLGNQSIEPLRVNATNPQNTTGTLATLGVDLTPPTLTFTNASVANQQIFNIATGAPTPGVDFFQVQATDAAEGGAAPSGFGPDHVLARVFRWFPNLNFAQQCRLPGAFSLANPLLGCRLTGTLGTHDVESLQGYLTYQATAVDQAGNLSEPLTAPISRIVLNDQTAPGASNIAIPASLVGGAATSFSATATDNLNLWRGDYRFEFGGVELLPLSERQIFNTRFVTSQAGLVTEATAAVTVNFVRSLETTDGGNAPSGPGTLQPATGVTLLVEDAAGNFFIRDNAFAGGTVPPGTSFSVAARGVATFQVSAPAAAQNVWNQIGTQPAPAADNPIDRTITATATGASGTFANPFTVVRFYHRAPGGVNELIGTAQAPSVTDDGTTRTWTWTITWTPAGAQAQANAPVFAVGVHSSGDALRTNDNANISIVGP